MNWPQDADGDVFRSLAESGFDFSSEALVDFNVDIPNPDVMGEAIDTAIDLFPDAAIGEEDDYFVVQINARLTYEFVIDMQRKLTAVSSRFGGKCDSWGVLT